MVQLLIKTVLAAHTPWFAFKMYTDKLKFIELVIFISLKIDKEKK